MPDILYSVGQGGVNRPDDVKLVQGLLNVFGPEMGGPMPKLEVDGWAGTKTIGAIRAFQAKQNCTVDGRVDPGGRTFNSLSALSTISGPAKFVEPPHVVAESVKPTSLMWLGAGITALQTAGVCLKTGFNPAFPFHVVLQQALDTHFKLNQSRNPEVFVSRAYQQAIQALGVLNFSQTVFCSRTDAEAAQDGAVKNGAPAPAYTLYGHRICFTNGFTKYGPLCKAAMVLHEPFHFVDASATGAIEVYEGEDRYANITPYIALHNPSSYVAFCEHVYYWSDRRYGGKYPNL